jgi:hypothetical protein
LSGFVSSYRAARRGPGADDAIAELTQPSWALDRWSGDEIAACASAYLGEPG